MLVGNQVIEPIGPLLSIGIVHIASIVVVAGLLTSGSVLSLEDVFVSAVGVVAAVCDSMVSASSFLGVVHFGSIIVSWVVAIEACGLLVSLWSEADDAVVVPSDEAVVVPTDEVVVVPSDNTVVVAGVRKRTLDRHSLGSISLISFSALIRRYFPSGDLDM